MNIANRFTEPAGKVKIFLDDDARPFGEYSTPIRFSLDTTKLTDGNHQLRIVSQSTDGKEGLKVINFTVRNGPAIQVEGLADGDIVDDAIPILINSYGSEMREKFIITGSETPKAIPSWMWVALLSFVGWSLFYFIMFWTKSNYQSFF